MLTSKQIKELPKGDYPNWRLMEIFPKQQGKGKSAKMVLAPSEEDKKKGVKNPSLFWKLINQFTGKEVKQRVRKTQNKG